MSDLFHEDVPEQFIGDVLDVIETCSHHTFILLTKRAWRLPTVRVWPTNVWLGVTAENQEEYDRRSEQLLVRSAKASVKWLSAEPLLGPIVLDDVGRSRLGWVVVGGESGPGARMPSARWVVSLRDQCVEARVPFFFKQWGGTNKKATGRLLHGQVWNEYPEP
jgi:protein gp37